MPLLSELVAFSPANSTHMALLTELGSEEALQTELGSWELSGVDSVLNGDLTSWDFGRAMANTYTQIYIQVVFAVEGRQNLIRVERKEDLQKYITGIVTRQGQKLIAVHCMPDHTHVFLGLKPNLALSDLVGDIKTGSSNHINENHWVGGRFSWQEGFGAFSYSHSQIPAVATYVRNQVHHHARKSFREEYLSFLKRFEVAHDERYIFKDPTAA